MKRMAMLVAAMPVHVAVTKPIVAGVKGSFSPGGYNEKRDCVRRVNARYDELAAECGISEVEA